MSDQRPVDEKDVPRPPAPTPLPSAAHPGTRPRAEDVRPISPDYAEGLRFAARIAHAEARWQTELAARTTDMRERARHQYTADSASNVEAAILAVSECHLPPGSGRSA